MMASEKTKIILHLGFHKTGTSSLQMAMSQAVDLPFLYPNTGRNRIWGAAHHDFAAPDIDDAILRDLTEEIKRSETDLAVISCEDLSFPDQLSRLAQLVDSLAEFDVELCCVLRRHDAYFELLYAENVKRGRTVAQPWDYFLANQHLLRFLERIRAFEEFTGCRARVLPYRPHLRMSEYIELITGRPNAVKDTFRYNKSLPPLVTAAIREVYAALGSYELNHVGRAYHFFDEVISEQVREKLHTFDCYLTEAERRTIFDITAEENLRLGWLFGGRRDFWWTPGREDPRRPVRQGTAAAMVLQMIMFEGATAYRNPAAGSDAR